MFISTIPPRDMPLSDQELARIDARMRKVLGRDLTPEERKLMLLSFEVAPPEKDEPNRGLSLVVRNPEPVTKTDTGDLGAERRATGASGIDQEQEC
jgi:hypothetical protein